MRYVSGLAMFSFVACDFPSPKPLPPHVVTDSGVFDTGDDDELDAGDELVEAAPRFPATCDGMCANLRARECSEGTKRDGGASCEELCTSIIARHLTTVPLRCLSAARTKAAVRLCTTRTGQPFVRCETTR